MFLARHAQSKHNIEKVGYLDVGDPPLSLLGEMQADSMQLLEHYGVEAIVTAKSLRAFQTGARAFGDVGLPMFVDSDLNEVRWGRALAGKRKEDIPAFQGPVRIDGKHGGLDLRPHPDTQTCLEKGEQMVEALHRWDSDGTLVISSKLALQSLFAVTLGWNRRQMLRFPIENGQVFRFDINHPDTPEPVFMPVVEAQALQVYLEHEAVLSEQLAA